MVGDTELVSSVAHCKEDPHAITLGLPSVMVNIIFVGRVGLDCGGRSVVEGESQRDERRGTREGRERETR